MVKPWTAFVVACALAFPGISAASAADVKAGSKCQTLNKTATSAGKSLQCKLVNKKLVWVVRGAASSAKSSAPTGPQAQKIISTYGNTIPLMGGLGTGSITATSGLAVAITSSTPDICTLDGAGLHLSATGRCNITANQAGTTSFLPATLNQTIAVTGPKLDAPDEQLTNAGQITLVAKNQTYKAELFEFQVLQVKDNADAAVCADSSKNEGCFLDSYGESKVDPKSANRYVKVHVKVHDTGTELMGPTFYFRLLVGTKIYDAQISVTLDSLNDATIQPGETAEGDYYLSLPKDIKIDQGYLIFDDTFVSADQAVIFAL